MLILEPGHDPLKPFHQWSLKHSDSDWEISYLGCFLTINPNHNQPLHQHQPTSKSDHPFFNLKDPTLQSQFCFDLGQDSMLIKPFPFYNFQLSSCACADFLPDPSTRLEDALCISYPHSTKIMYWALHSSKPSNLLTFRDRSIQNIQSIPQRLLARQRVRKSLAVEMSSSEEDRLQKSQHSSDNPQDVQNHALTQKTLPHFHDRSSTSIFAPSPESADTKNNSMSIFAIVVACFSFFIGIYCLVLLIKRRGNKQKNQEGLASIVIPATPLTRSAEEWNPSMSSSIDIVRRTSQEKKPDFQPVITPSPPRSYLSVIPAAIVQRPGTELQDTDRSANPEGYPEIKTQFLTQIAPAHHQLKDRVSIQNSLDSYPNNPQKILPAIWEHCQNHEQRSIVNQNPLDQTDFTVSKTVDDFENSFDKNVPCSVVEPEKLARESYPHPKLTSSSLKTSPIAPISRNSWILKCPPSLRPTVSQLSPSSSSKPQPVRKLKSSFGVGLENTGDTTKELSQQNKIVEKSEPVVHELLDDTISKPFLTPNKASIGVQDWREQNPNLGRPLTSDGNCPSSSELEDKVNLSPSIEKLDRSNSKTNQLETQSSHRSNSDHFPTSHVSFRDGLSPMNSISSNPCQSQYLSLSGFSKIPDLSISSKSIIHFPEKPMPKMKSLTTLGNKLSHLAYYYPPSTPKAKNYGSKESVPGIMKRPSFHPSLNWGRRKRDTAGNWKRFNSVSSHTRSRFANSFSISSDALDCLDDNQSQLKKIDKGDCPPAAPWASSPAVEKRRIHRHKHSKSVPDNIFLSPLNLDPEGESESEARPKLSVMNPDRESIASEMANSGSSVQNPEEDGIFVNQCLFRFSIDTRIAFRGSESLNSKEDGGSVGSTSNSSACKTPTMEKMCRATLSRSVNPLFETFNSNQKFSVGKEPLKRIHSQNRSLQLAPQSAISRQVSDPISFSGISSYRKTSPGYSTTREGPPPELSASSNGKELGQHQSPERTFWDTGRRAARCQSEIFAGKPRKGKRVHQSSWHPIYNLPILSSIPPNFSAQGTPSSENHQHSSSESIKDGDRVSRTPNGEGSTSASTSTSHGLQVTSSPPIYISPVQVISESPSISDRKSDSSELGMQTTISGLRVGKDRYRSGGGISATSSDDYLSFGTGAASDNSEPMWISRLNSAGSFATHQSLDEQNRLWVANPDGTYSPSLESVFNHSSRLNVSPGIASASGSSIVCQ